MPEFHVIIPARYQSNRLPGKPLLDIGAKTMIERVVDVANQSGAASVTVATDDARIQQAVLDVGGNVVMTAIHHQSGTDRVAEACAALGLADDAVVVNLQGDEPLMPPALLRQVAELLLQTKGSVMATLCTALDRAEEFTDPAVVKVVVSEERRALYFSRAPIPWSRADDSSGLAEDAWRVARRHLGIYAYQSGYIQRYAAQPAAALEATERLEQLRILANGEIIACADALEAPAAGVDNADDLQRVRQIFAAR